MKKWLPTAWTIHYLTGRCAALTEENARLHAVIADNSLLARQRIAAVEADAKQDRHDLIEDLTKVVDENESLRPRLFAWERTDPRLDAAINALGAIRICKRCDKALPEGCGGSQHGNLGCALNNPDHADRYTRRDEG